MEKIIHQIWVGPYEMPDREKEFVRIVREKHPGFAHELWTNSNLPELPEKVKTLFDSFERQKDYAHQADVLRIFLVAKYGGLYLDVDFKCNEGFENTDFFDYSELFCYHGGTDYTMPNGFFGGTKDSPMMKHLLENVDAGKGGWYGPSWLGDTVKSYFGLNRETPHSELIPHLDRSKIKYLLFHELEEKYFRHHALYSWSPENKKNFEEGNINYLK